MEDDQNTEVPETPETPVPDPAPEADDKPEEKPEDALPDWARKELTDVRNEAARYRTRAREAEDALKNAKTPEEFAAAVADFTAKNAELQRSLLITKVAAKYDLPEPLANRLSGDDEASIEADAKALAALITTKREPESLSGGLTPGDSDDEFDPVAAAHKAKQRRY